MEKYFSIGETARAVNVTCETLRHYDRIGLVTPSKRDDWTGYRYYTKSDIIRLHAVRALQCMDLPLKEIRQILEYNDLGKIIGFLTQAEQSVDAKIKALEYSKSKIRAARRDFESKLAGHTAPEGVFVTELPERVIMLSDTYDAPTLDNLWNYLSHFYDKIKPSERDKFDFEDLAGIYTENGVSRLFATCIRHGAGVPLKALPSGKYLAADCTAENRAAVLAELMRTAECDYGVRPTFSIQLIVLSGILQWNYQAQVYLGNV